MNFGRINQFNLPASLQVSTLILSFAIAANSQITHTPGAETADTVNEESPQIVCSEVIQRGDAKNGCSSKLSSAIGVFTRQDNHFDSITVSPISFLAPDKRKAPGSSNSGEEGWHFAFAPYFYLTGIRGTVGARGRTIDLDASFGKVWDNLDLGIMGTVEVSKKRFVSLTDVQWIKLSNKRDTPGGLFETAKVGVNLFILDPEAGYRVLTSKAGALDVLGGARIWSVETNLNVTSGRLPGFDVSQRKTFAAPVVGVRGVFNLSPKFYLTGKFDIGGAGIGADLTTQVFGGAGYRLFPRMALVGGYRYLQVDYDDSKGFLFDTRMNGIVIGAKFSF